MKTLFLALLLCVPAFAQNNQNNFGGSGSSSVNAPATYATATGVYNAAQSGLVSDSLNPACSVTNGQSVVTCPANTFTAANCAVGMMMQGGNLTSGQILNTGTISSCDSATQVHVSTTASATATSTLEFAWGPDQTANLSAACTAAASSALFIPAGYYFTTTAQCNSNTTAPMNITGPGGWANTTILPTYNFNFATCTGGTGNSCFFGRQYQNVAYMTVDGMYGGSSAATLRLVEDQGGYFNLVRGNDWCSTCANSWGMGYTSNSSFAIQGSMVNFGTINCVVNGAEAIGILNVCLTLAGGSGTAAPSSFGIYCASGNIISIGNYYSASTSIQVQSGCTMDSLDDSTNVAGGAAIINNGIHIMRHFTPNVNTTIANHSGGVLRISDSDFSGVTSTWLTNSSGGFVFDMGGNGYPASHAASNSGTYVGPFYSGFTVITGAKAVLSAGWGTTAAWTNLAGYNNFSGTLTASGTGQAASPTITYTFPSAYAVAPAYCNVIVRDTTQSSPATWSSSSLTATAVTFTYNGTPTAGAVWDLQISCVNN